MSEKMLAVTPLQQGTVIDHILAGSALKISRLLSLTKESQQISIGLNFSSSKQGKKDLIKISDRELSKEEASQIAVLAPLATINIIREGVVSEKYLVKIPKEIPEIFLCPNPLCITQSENINSCFHVTPCKNSTKLTCKYCKRTFPQEQVSLKS